MRVFSFNKVIYDGYLSADLFFYVIRNKPTRIIDFLKIIPTLIMFAVGRLTSKQVFEKFYKLLLSDITITELELFKANNIYKLDLRGFGVERNDFITTMEPDYLIDLFLDRKKYRIICTKYDLRDYKIIGELAEGKELLRRLEEEGVMEIEQLFIYSFKEKSLIEIAASVFIFRGHVLIDFNTYDGTLRDRVWNSLLHRKTVSFIFITFISLIITIVMSMFFSAISDVIRAFILGYLLWILGSYFLVMQFVFKTGISFRSAFDYLASFLPNFLLQLFLIILITMLIGFNSSIVLLIVGIVTYPLLIFALKFFDFE
jgi:hypothetical protein